MVTHQLRTDDLRLATNHVLQPSQQVGDGDLLLDPVAGTVEVAKLHAGQVEDCLTQGFGRDRASVDADAPNHRPAVDDAHLVAELGRHNRSLLPARTRANDRKVEIVRVLHSASVPEERHVR